VLFDGTRAVGVAYHKDGVEQQVRVGKEVILSGGAINSPQILLLSGVGPADHLRALDIRVVADLPGVGDNLHDHPAVLTYFTTKPSFSQFGSVPEGVAFIKTQADLPKPNIQMMFSPYFFFPRVGSGYTFSILLVDVLSRGQLKLRSTDPTQYPTILANYLSNEADLQALIEAVKITRRLSHTRAFAPFYAENAYPDASTNSDQEIVEYIRADARTTFHPVGTCKMGEDEMAVVDAQLRVHGISGLRVVDASIMPTIVTGNTNAATIMIAEKAADLIRA
jgi:choline dehydrogenase